MDLGSTVVHLSGWQIFALLLTWSGGVLVNYANKVSREGVDRVEYWTRNPLATISSIVVSLGICISLILSGETNHLTYFTVAFMAENLINTGPRKVQDDVEKNQKQ